MPLDRAATEPAPGTSRLVAAVAGLGAVVLLAGVAASQTEQPTAELPTVVASADPGAVLVSARGERPARPGARVRRGTTVRTTGGELVLTTGDRDVRLAPATSLTVLDGARQQLDAGSALVDARTGRALQVAVGGVVVDVDEDAMVRLDGGELPRVAAYAGAADVGTPGRRARTELSRLEQVQVPAGTLPSGATPLALRAGDRWEGRVLRSLVAADEELRLLAQGLRDGTTEVSAVVPASTTQRVGTPVEPAESTLAFALAHDERGFDAGVFDEVLEGRRLGGSWAVVAELAGTSLRNATAWIEQATPGQVADAVDAARAAGDGDAPLLDLALPGGEPAPAPTAGQPEPTRSARPSAGPRPTTTPSTGPQGPLAPVQDVVEEVLDLLPAPPPAVPTRPTRAPLVRAEVDVPLLEPLVDPLLGG